jgi:4a-hydroxytetrahydrobiopterin dehydratase
VTKINELADAHCTPLRGEEHRLPRAAIDGHLAALPGWELDPDGGRIRKTFRFDDYYRTMAFVNALAFVAHREDHHPDLGVHYNRCVVEYSTHDVGGLSRNDFICAAKAERLAAP